MQGWKRLQFVYVAVIFACLLGMVFVAAPAARAVLLIPAIACTYMWLMEQRRQREEAHHQSLIKTVNRFRHDWMNDLQVVFGYIRLKKYDLLTDYVEKIKERAAQESFVSKLGVPSLVVYLLAYRTDKRAMELEVDIVQEIRLDQLPLDVNAVTERIRQVIDVFHANAIPSDNEPNRLSLQFDLIEDSLLLDFDYQGLYRESLKKSLEVLESNMQRRSGTLDANGTEEGVTLTLSFAFDRKREQAGA